MPLFLLPCWCFCCCFCLAAAIAAASAAGFLTVAAFAAAFAAASVAALRLLLCGCCFAVVIFFCFDALSLGQPSLEPHSQGPPSHQDSHHLNLSGTSPTGNTLIWTGTTRTATRTKPSRIPIPPRHPGHFLSSQITQQQVCVGQSRTRLSGWKSAKRLSDGRGTTVIILFPTILDKASRASS